MSKNLIFKIITACLVGTLPSIFLNKPAEHTYLKEYRTYFQKTIFYNHTLHICVDEHNLPTGSP